MGDTGHRLILNRVGRVLVIVGLLDIALMVWCLATSGSYSSSLNIFAVVAGIFLQRGSLNAARFVRMFAVFFGSALAAVIIAFPFIEPVGLTMVRARQQPLALAGLSALTGLLLFLFYWVAAQLGRREVRSATEESGRKWRSGAAPAVIGLLMVATVTGFMHRVRQGEDGQRLVQLARAEAGDNFNYTVSSYSAQYSSDTSSVRGVVTAWNDSEIRVIPVGWDE